MKGFHPGWVFRPNLRHPGYAVTDITTAAFMRAHRHALFAGLIFGCLLGATPAVADVSDVAVTDVTTRAFSVVWAADESVTNATVHVFSDPEGLTDITAGLSVTLISSGFPPALEQGIVKVDVTGLAADTPYYVETETTSASGVLIFPPMPEPLLEVRTALATTKANASNEPIVNDLIQHEVFEPDGTTPAAGALLLVKAPAVSTYPLSAFVGDGVAAPTAIVDLNNLFNDETHRSAEVLAGDVLELTEFRGLRCNPEEQKLIRLRRAPEHEEAPPISELEAPVSCFFADTVCDNTVNILDVQRVLNILDRAIGECRFNSDLDVVEDGVIDILDVQRVLDWFGQSAPFE